MVNAAEAREQFVKLAEEANAKTETLFAPGTFAYRVYEALNAYNKSCGPVTAAFKALIEALAGVPDGAFCKPAKSVPVLKPGMAVALTKRQNLHDYPLNHPVFLSRNDSWEDSCYVEVKSVTAFGAEMSVLCGNYPPIVCYPDSYRILTVDEVKKIMAFYPDDIVLKLYQHTIGG